MEKLELYLIETEMGNPSNWHERVYKYAVRWNSLHPIDQSSIENIETYRVFQRPKLAQIEILHINSVTLGIHIFYKPVLIRNIGNGVKWGWET